MNDNIKFNKQMNKIVSRKSNGNGMNCKKSINHSGAINDINNDNEKLIKTIQMQISGGNENHLKSNEGKKTTNI